MKTTLISSLIMISLMIGCIPQSKIVVISPKKTFAKSISTLAIINNQLIIRGAGLEGTQSIKIQGTSFDETFTVESATSTQIIANAQRAISIGANQVFDLIISNATASATFPISITLDNGSVTAPKLASMGAGVGQVLQYNGTAWVPSNISTGQMYMGTWNATTDTPDIAGSSPQAGEYYIVTTSGTQNLGAGAVSYSIGDWVIYNGSTWDKIAISNNTVASFNGRSGVVVPASGDYTWSQIAKTGSKLEDILDIDITGRADGKILKWHAGSSKWIIADDVDTVGGTTFTGTANRAVATDGAGALTSSAVTATELGYLSGVTSAIQTQLNGKVTSVNTETGAVILTTGDIAESGSNLYTTNARTIGATLTGYTAGSNTVLAATDTVLGAFQKVQGQITAREPAITAGTTAQYLRGDKTLSTFATDAINSALTGLSTATSTSVTATDSIVVGMGKLQAQINGSATAVGNKADLTNGTQTITAMAVTGLAAPTSGSDAANKTYVDSVSGTWTVTGGNISRDTGNVGIGIAPGSKLDVKGTLRLSGSTSGYVGFAPAAAAGTTTYTLPITQGTAGQVLSTDGVATTPTLSWITPSGGGAVSSVNTQTGAVVLTTSDIAEGTNLYSTNARTIASTLTGFAAGANSTILATDTVLGALQKTQGQINAKEPAITAGTTAQYLRGDKSLSTFATDAINSALTGLSTATSTAVTATDSVLVGMGKLQAQASGQTTALANKADTTNVTQTITALAVTGLGAPVAGSDATNKTYVDSVAGAWTVASGNVYRSSGNVGIGTTAPGAALSFANTTGDKVRYYDGGAGERLGLGVNTFETQNYMPSTNHISFNIGGDLQPSGTNEIMRIMGSGRVGIGTIAPGSALDVKGTLRLSGSTSGYVGFAPAAAAGTTTYTLPITQGTAGQVLSTDGVATTPTLTWITPSGGGAVSSVNTQTGAVVLTTSEIAEGTNLYSTNARTIASTLTGFSAGTNTALAATDTVLGAFQKVQGQITAREPAITAGTTAQYLRGDKSLSTFATDAINSALTGLSTATSTAVTATDSIVVGMGKLQAQASGQTTALANKADTTNVTQTITALAVTGLGAPFAGSDAANKTYVDSVSGTWTVTGGNISRDTGNVGIGTAPGSKLDVKGTLRLSGSTSGYVGFAPAAAAGTTTYTLPITQGTAGQVLSTDGVATTPTLSWVTPSGGGAVSSVNTQTGAVVLTTSDIAEGTNLYSTNARTIASTLTGFSAGANTALAATDTVLGAFQKVQGQITAREPAITAGTTAQYLRGDKSLSTFATDAINSALTGLSTATSTAVTATDSIVVGVGKLQGQVSGNTTTLSGKADRTNVTQTITALAVTGLGAPVAGSDAANKTYVDSVAGAWTVGSGNAYRTTGYVGIGTATPDTLLEISGDSNNAPWDPAVLTVKSAGNDTGIIDLISSGGTKGARTATSNTTEVGAIRFKGYDGTTNTIIGRIVSVVDGAVATGSVSGKLNFETAMNSGRSTKMTILSGGNVGIGTETPANKLVVNVGATLGDGAKVIGTNGPMNSVSNGTYKLDFGLATSAGYYSSIATAGDGVVRTSGASSNGNLIFTNQNATGGILFTTGSSDINDTVKMRITNAGYVGVGVTTPSEMIETSGNVKAVGFISTSDMRLKENITKTQGLEKVIKLQGVEYDWKKSGEHDYGLIAQAVEKIFPHAVVTDEVTGYKAVKYSNLISPVIEAIKDLFNMITKTSTEVTHIKRELASVKEKNAQLASENEKMKKDFEELKKRMDRLEQKK